jgi:predicted dienelactone hydrolase
LVSSLVFGASFHWRYNTSDGAMVGYLSKLMAKLLLAAAVLLFGLAVVACSDEENASPTATAIASPTAGAAASPTATLTPTVSAEALTERGPFAVGVTTLTLVDESRPTDANGSYAGADSRTLVTEVWYPAEGTARAGEMRDAPLNRTSAPYPLIVYSHGILANRRYSASYTTHLASHGYVVVSPDFPLTNFNAPGGARASDVLNQPGDVTFLIDSVLGLSRQAGHLLEGAIDEEAIGLTGHSLGGMTTVLATFGPLRDPRVKAALPMAAPSCLVGAATYETSAVPMLVMAGTADGVVSWPSARAAYDMAPPPKYLLALVGGNHLRFGDFDVEDSFLPGLQSLPGFAEENARIVATTGADLTSCIAPAPADLPTEPPLTGDRQHELMNLFATAFFDRYLKGDEAAASVLTAEFIAGVPDVRLESDLGP